MAQAFFHIGLGILVAISFAFSFHNGFTWLTLWNGVFTVVNFTYAGYLLGQTP